MSRSNILYNGKLMQHTAWNWIKEAKVICLWYGRRGGVEAGSVEDGGQAKCGSMEGWHFCKNQRYPSAVPLSTLGGSSSCSSSTSTSAASSTLPGTNLCPRPVQQQHKCHILTTLLFKSLNNVNILGCGNNCVFSKNNELSEQNMNNCVRKYGTLW